MINLDGTVKRMDLELRLKYLGVKTKIYQINNYEYVIYCEIHEKDFQEMSDSFNSSIRQVGTNVRLVKTPPEYYKQFLEEIPFSNVVQNFQATCITEPDIFNFVESKFHNVDITNLEIRHHALGYEILILFRKKHQVVLWSK